MGEGKKKVKDEKRPIGPCGRRKRWSETARNINAVFGEGSTTKATVGNWFKNFRDGDFSLANEPRGRPKTKVDNDHLRAVVESDPSQSTRELASIFNVSIPTILVHLAAIGKIKKLDK
ncbi:hypothetical protein DMN91_010178 [Ooceraea biroi]|uniref:Mos1 transposase HTH domain-containing protein n=1 Tax=Ooceraea biroi TaxID=2015173 RepID=A0A3L8DDG9_OOCBI|nr:hypothetical protein DMN91_010178 [Ooceraea biroi]